jgi:hypothetical protein
MAPATKPAIIHLVILMRFLLNPNCRQRSALPFAAVVLGLLMELDERH